MFSLLYYRERVLNDFFLYFPFETLQHFCPAGAYVASRSGDVRWKKVHDVSRVD